MDSRSSEATRTHSARGRGKHLAHALELEGEEIVRVAREREVDLIVIATHGYTGLKISSSAAPRSGSLHQKERDFVS